MCFKYRGKRKVPGIVQTPDFDLVLKLVLIFNGACVVGCSKEIYDFRNVMETLSLFLYLYHKATGLLHLIVRQIRYPEQPFCKK